TFLCNTPAEVAEMRERGVKAHHSNHNLFVNENVFKVVPDIPKAHDAVYNARISPFKRHQLCTGIDSLALIYYFLDSKDEVYFQKIKSMLPSATYVNGPDEYRWLSADEVTRELNASRVGLCLSDAEGAMKACVEYQLCGLP